MDLKFNFNFNLGFIKKYSALLLPAGLVLAALVLLLPTKLISNSVIESLEESERMNRDISSLLNKAVPKDQWKLEAEYQEAHKTDTNNIELLVKQTTQRELINYSIFPEPRVQSNIIFQNFGQEYISRLENLAGVVMQAGDAPSEEYLRTLTGDGSRSTSRDRENMGVSAAERIINMACIEKANQIPVYANPEKSFIGYDFWKDYRFVSKEKGITDCWDAQITYWIIEDIAKTIKEINSGSSRVMDSKVKRLLEIRFSNSQSSSGGYGSREGGSVMETPFYVLPDQAAGLTTAWTGRVTSDKIDVVHFRFSVIISADSIPEFYSILCGDKEHKFYGWDGNSPEQSFKHNQITILEEKVNKIDTSSEFHKNYRYGTDAIVQLDLICEYIFQKAGYDDIKPESIKIKLAPVEDTY